MITLTYNDKYLPKDGNVNKTHVQKFVKRLRKKIEPKRVSFYGCGEYGAKFERPHYHICLFNYSFPDKEIFNNRWIRRSRYSVQERPDYRLYISKELGKLWPYGFHTIGKVTLESAGYTARYVTKKITGKKHHEHYKNKIPEFALMSLRPAIGKQWILKNWNDVYPKDYFTINGNKFRPPRYYDEQLKKIKPDIWIEVEKKRKEFAEERGVEISCDAWNRERYRKKITQRLERKMELDGESRNICNL